MIVIKLNLNKIYLVIFLNAKNLLCQKYLQFVKTIFCAIFNFLVSRKLLDNICFLLWPVLLRKRYQKTFQHFLFMPNQMCEGNYNTFSNSFELFLILYYILLYILIYYIIFLIFFDLICVTILFCVLVKRILFNFVSNVCLQTVLSNPIPTCHMWRMTI